MFGTDHLSENPAEITAGPSLGLREALDQWDFVLAAYAITIIATLALVGWSWLAMRAAERRREEGRK